jgi:hypothetical protein
MCSAIVRYASALYVAVELVVRRGLVGEDVRDDPSLDQTSQQVGRIGDDADRTGLASALQREGAVDGGVDPVDPLVQISGSEALVDARLVHLRSQERRLVHRRREWLRPTHAAQAGCHHEAAAQASPEVLARRRREALIGALKDALRPDVDP